MRLTARGRKNLITGMRGKMRVMIAMVEMDAARADPAINSTSERHWATRHSDGSIIPSPSVSCANTHARTHARTHAHTVQHSEYTSATMLCLGSIATRHCLVCAISDGIVCGCEGVPLYSQAIRRSRRLQSLLDDAAGCRAKRRQHLSDHTAWRCDGMAIVSCRAPRSKLCEMQDASEEPTAPNAQVHADRSHWSGMGGRTLVSPSSVSLQHSEKSSFINFPSINHK
jgi:hypothetical protein